MITPADPRLPRILDDEWEPPPPGPNRVPVIVAAALFVLVCGVFVTVSAGVWDRDSARSVPDFYSLPTSSSLALGYPGEAETPRPLVDSQPPSARPAVKAASTRVSQSTSSLIGYVSVNSTPWAQLSVDGRWVGTTPRVGIRLSPGRHRVVLSRNGFASETAWVTVAPGTAVKITGITLKPIAP